MSFLEGLDFVAEFLSSGNNNSPKKNSVINSVFSFILFIGALLFSFMLKQLFNLFHPVLFLVQFGLIGFVFSVGLIIVMYKLNWIEQISRKDFLIISISICLIIISVSCLINYKCSTMSPVYKSYFIVGIDKEIDSYKITANREGKSIKLRDSSQLRKQLNLNDSIRIRETSGFFGYNFIDDFALTKKEESE